MLRFILNPANNPEHLDEGGGGGGGGANPPIFADGVLVI